MKKAFKKCGMLKIILIVFAVAVILTWMIPAGTFSGATLTDSGLNRVGIVDMIQTLYVNSPNFMIVQLVFLLFLGAFYGVLNKLAVYKQFTKSIAEKLEGKEIIIVVLTTLAITLFTTFSTNVYAALLFIPLFISIFSQMKMDKITTFAATFGGILIGSYGALYCSNGIEYFNYYGGTTYSTLFGWRVALMCIAFFTLCIFTILRIKKYDNKKKVNEEDMAIDLFATEEVATKKKTIAWPLIVILSILFIFQVLGFIDWAGNFGINAFTNFHTWLTGLTIGNVPIFASIMGTSAVAFGQWTLITLMVVMTVFMLILIIMYRMSFGEMLESMGEGLKKMIKPTLLVLAAYSVFVIVYSATITPTIVNWINGLSDKFNAFLVTLSTFVTSIFHTDAGFTGFSFGAYYAAAYPENINGIMLIVNSISGLAAFCVPTSVILLVGLDYLNIPYSKWLKFIWKFLAIIFVVTFIVITIVA